MANLAERHEKPTIRTLRQDNEQLRALVRFLRSSLNLVGRAEFPAGIIPPSALQQATAEPGLVSLTGTNFAVDPTSTVLLSASATVPHGFTGCVVSLVGRVFSINSTASDAYLSAQIQTASITGNAVPVHAAASGAPDDSGLNVTTFATVLDGLVEGEAITVELAAWTDAATWSADPSNLADLTGSIVWFA